MDDIKNDEDFWLNAGADFAHKRWVSADLTTDELKTLGQHMVQTGPGAASQAAEEIEASRPELTRR